VAVVVFVIVGATRPSPLWIVIAGSALILMAGLGIVYVIRRRERHLYVTGQVCQGQVRASFVSGHEDTLWGRKGVMPMSRIAFQPPVAAEPQSEPTLLGHVLYVMFPVGAEVTVLFDPEQPKRFGVVTESRIYVGKVNKTS